MGEKKIVKNLLVLGVELPGNVSFLVQGNSFNDNNSSRLNKRKKQENVAGVRN